MGLRPWDSEHDAGDVVCSRLGGVVHRVDPGGGPEQVHDFDLRLDDGRTIAVEVTRHTVAADLSRASAVARRDWQFSTLHFNWVVDMVGAYDVKSVHGKIEQPLVALEASGVEQIMRREEFPSEGPAAIAAAQLFALGAGLVYRLRKAENGGGIVAMGEKSQGGVTAPEVIVGVVEHHANLDDNRAKLARAAAVSERHLFIWIDSSQQQAVAAMMFGVLPKCAPALPDFIDAVWVATAFDSARIWRFRRGEWLSLGTWRREVES